MIPETVSRSPAAASLIADMAAKYIWWDVDGAPHPERRALAQVMNLGTYDDIRLIEKALGMDVLADVLARAEPGWFTPRSWDFWRGRLSHATGREFPEAPPRRSYSDASML